MEDIWAPLFTFLGTALAAIITYWRFKVNTKIKETATKQNGLIKGSEFVTKLHIDELTRLSKSVEFALKGKEECEKAYRRCEEEQNQIRQQLTRLLASRVSAATGAVITANEDGIITDCNIPAMALTRRTKEELIGKNVVELVPADMKDQHSQAFGRWRAANRPPNSRLIQIRILRGDATELKGELDLSESYQNRAGEWVLVASLRQTYSSFQPLLGTD